MTVWEMICARWNKWFGPPPPPPPTEEQHYNPLKIKLGISTLTVDTLDLRKYTFIVQSMQVYRLNYDNKSFLFTDYLCRSTLQEGDPVEIKVRVYPHDEPGRDLQMVILRKWDEIDYAEDFKILLEDEQFNVADDKTPKEETSFWRINGVKTPYQANTVVVDSSETSNVSVDYWDYWREATDELGSYKEFLFVEWDKKDTGRFTIWRGEEVPQSRITV